MKEGRSNVMTAVPWPLGAANSKEKEDRACYYWKEGDDILGDVYMKNICRWKEMNP